MNQKENIHNKNIHNKKIYCIDYWKDFLDENSIEEEKIHTIVYNPRELFKEFAEEIKRNEFKNQDNKKFFMESISTFSKLPIQSIDFLKSTLTLITGQFNKPNFPYLLHLLSEIDILLSNDQLGLKCVDELTNILTNDKPLNEETQFKINNKNKATQKDQIKILTQLIIFQLIHHKYSIKSIQKVIDDIFSGYDSDKYEIGRDYDKPIIYTRFLHNLKPENGDITSQDYQDKLKDLLDNLTLTERLLAIQNYFHREKMTRTYLFQIQGLNTENDDFDINFGNVRIYNPKNIKLIKTPFRHQSEPPDELFGSPYLIYCNGAVTLEVVDYEYAKDEAIASLNNVINILYNNDFGDKLPIRIKTEQIYVIDENGTQKGTIPSARKNYDSTNSYAKSTITLKESNIKDMLEFYNSRLINLSNVVDQKISDSLYWKGKAIESLSANEKILWFWVSIENLVNTNRIFDIGSKLLAFYQLYNFAWKHYDKVYRRTINYKGGYFGKKLKMPTKLVKAIGFNKGEGETISLKDFIDNIPKIMQNLNKKELLYEQLEYLNSIFQDSTKCIKLLEKFEQLAQEKLRHIYRIRNKIVHNASSEQNTLTQYYLDFLSIASMIITQKFIEKRHFKNLKTIEDILNYILYDFDKLKIDLKNDGTQILFNSPKEI